MNENADRYRALAAECLDVARRFSNADDKVHMLDLATTWLKLAEHSETIDRRLHGIPGASAE
jgi:hypothetical protein